MRKKFALSLFTTLLLLAILDPLAAGPAYAADNVKQIINAAGIMETDKGSNEDGTQIVTRDRFAQMLVNASIQKDTATSDSSVSLFSDVKKTYWAAGYIQSAVTQGWMSGYLNGKFKPTQGISLQEAASGVVKLLGYSNSDFSGSLSIGIMNLYKTKGLNHDISKSKTQYLTVNDCYNLFYNTLTATTKNGNIYGTTLGYTVNSNGKLDYLSLVSTGMEGPIVADEDWKDELPFSTAQATYYKNGTISKLSDISDYDVLYYSESLKTVWIYDNKITGTVELINPDYTAPQSVTVAGKNYSFADSNVSIKFSSMGDVKAGDVVTLILDKDNVVVNVLTNDEYNTTITGVVTGTGTHPVETNGTYAVMSYVTLVDASGNEYQQDYDRTANSFITGDLARITFSDGVATVSKVTLGSTSFGSNTFNSNGSKLGNYGVASNIKIIDLRGTNYISIYPERLAGVTLPAASVYYYELDKNGEISQLILNNLTGDMDKYGIFTGIAIQGASDKLNYNYMIGSVSGVLSTNNISSLNTKEGPSSFLFTNNVLTNSYALTGAEVTAIGTTTVQIGSLKFAFADEYYAYQRVGDEYMLTTLSKISDLSKFNIKAYYDKAASDGGRIRIIVAESK